MPIEQSPEIDQLASALAKAQGKFEAVAKSEDADIGSYGYKYADLAGIMESIRPILAECELAVSQFPSLTVAGQSLATVILHSSGQWMRSEMELPVGANPTAQQLGSAITYARRYALSAALGIVTDVDDDGKSASENPIVRRSTLRKDDGELASEAQCGLVNTLWAQLGVEDRDERLRLTAELVGVDELASTRDLTKAQVSPLIDELKARAKSKATA